MKMLDRFLLARKIGQKDDIVFGEDAVWLSRQAMAEFFCEDPAVLEETLAELFAEGELDAQADIARVQAGARPGKTSDNVGEDLCEKLFFSLDALLAVGFRLQSPEAVRFRGQATSVLGEFVVKGFVLDDERLKQGRSLLASPRDGFVVADDFNFLEALREIRISERRIWQRLTDLYADCSLDYDVDAPCTRSFYAHVLGRFYPAIAEAQAGRQSLAAPAARQRICPAGPALTTQEIRHLENSLDDYFAYVEERLARGNVYTMQEFAASITAFLALEPYHTLPDRSSAARARNVRQSAGGLVADPVSVGRGSGSFADTMRSLRGCMREEGAF